MSQAIWQATDVTDAKHLGTLELESGEYFEVLQTDSRLVFGGACNVGFLESGYMEIESGETTDEALSELLQELETYYRDGKQFVSRIVCNERM